ncbi:hypothetical protein EDI_304410 [Entamoeba dispar SAW760]|uniref:Uncharacterized protein n=1 Tax=Entamoeba dispar (strain ATCC PRA-260 / SAW760) TaxID=370354 RepID=B0E9G8_ENTDS|nr:uncharacterized protein EDI_304410 [Entamoeba dispar SAW760]EDR28827.1 hypothetical protein EDI_304410 [Entamoeba dispar SAW760]|eukprot:EDR28827.1 hypothetical protein EDI_304410 [Entamoeba dispar SAW760]
MYGTKVSNYPDRFINKEEEITLEENGITIKDLNILINDIIDVSESADILVKGVSVTLGEIPLTTLNKTLSKHLETLEIIKKEIKSLEKRNRLIISKIKKEDDKEKELEKKIKEETKPAGRKTELLYFI